MMAPMPGRVSQNLPIPKCSTCNQFVPLEDLGDHICTPIPPVPKSVVTATAAATLLPKGRTPSPSISRSVSPVPPNTSQSTSPPLPQPPVNDPTNVTFQLRASPLAASNVGSQAITNAGPSRDTSLSINTSSSMLTRLPQGDNHGVRARAPSNASVTSARPTPTTARPTMYSNQDTFHPQPPGSPPSKTPSFPSIGPLGQHPPSPIRNLPRGALPLGHRGPPPGLSISRSGTPADIVSTGNMIPPRSPAPRKIVDFSGTNGPDVIISKAVSPRQSFVPPLERGIDTKTGGEAGMAGVGRRGFAAVARAAMFALPPSRPLGPQAPKPNSPNYLDLDAVSRPPETPPLSAGSGYSSHSPGPTSPLPQSELASQPFATKITRTPSPLDRFVPTPTQSEPLKPATSDPVTLISPQSARFPFFEKFKNKIPGNNSTANNDSSISSLNSSILRKNTSDSTRSGDSSMLYRSVTSSTNSSQPMKDTTTPISPIDSESEYGGLAYADSTDYEDNEGQLLRSQSKNDSDSDIASFILRSGSNSSSRRRRFPSGSEYSENSNDRKSIVIGSTRPRSRNTSASSVSSTGGRGLSITRSNSSAIAQALGLSQTLPSDYGKLGGPGVMGTGGRMGWRESSSGRRNAGSDSMEEMGKVPEEPKIKTRTKQPSFGSSSQRSHLYRADTNSTVASSRKDDDVIGSPGGLKAHRSNTIQSPRPNSPEIKPVKLPMRALTSPKLDRDKALDGTGVKERVRKAKVCLKCQKVVDNSRWVSVDGGGVLCERCWKNMYLPKCRRCNLSIERQAVSSSDGQLKGKYHKECFNCDTCHKPFPDKTFYVYDGKPFCAYHYHEANDSLCAAARCGQPIEGPCAVSHSGDRYHPEHMTCEHSGYPPCEQMLSEYWEIDGRMLCERHAHSASVRGSDEEDEEWEETTRAKKRVTQFIDLTGGIGGFGGLGESGLR